MQSARRAGFDYYYGDHGYWGRGQYYRCTRNALQHDGVRGPLDAQRARDTGAPIVKDWRNTGSEIVIAPQTDAFMRANGIDPALWRSDVTRWLREHTDRPIVWSRKGDAIPFVERIRTAWAVVVHTSMSALEAVCEGVPAFALGDCALNSVCARDLSLIEQPPQPEGRERLLAVLACNQWTFDEYRSGMAWAHMREQGGST